MADEFQVIFKLVFDNTIELVSSGCIDKDTHREAIIEALQKEGYVQSTQIMCAGEVYAMLAENELFKVAIKMREIAKQFKTK